MKSVNNSSFFSLKNESSAEKKSNSLFAQPLYFFLKIIFSKETWSFLRNLKMTKDTQHDVRKTVCSTGANKLFSDFDIFAVSLRVILVFCR